MKPVFVRFILRTVMITLIGQALCFSARAEKPLRLGVAGVSHGHVYEVVRRLDRGDFTVVGVAERDDALRARNALTGKVDSDLFFADLQQMLDQTRPEAVIVYEPIFDHLRVVEICAPRGIHVMVEKPLAVSNAHAERMAQLAREHNIHLLTNYETTWYPTNHEAYRLIHDEDFLGKITRIEVYDGHPGPIEIGCGKEFTDWLTDPVLNGGGAVIDFGCYGLNLATWLFRGEKPIGVYAVLQQQKPKVYPLVDDDATILLRYPCATVQVMGSWNWPVYRKDMHIYGQKGYIYQETDTRMRVYETGKRESRPEPPVLATPVDDPFYYLKAVVRGQIEVQPHDLSALENNLTVVELLEAAIESSRTGQEVILVTQP